MPEQPLRPLSPSEVEAFRRDGVVCAPAVMPPHWIERMAGAVERSLRDPSPLGAMISKQEVGFTNDLFLWLRDDDYRAFVFESPAPLLARQAIGSRGLSFFYDQLFVKEPGTQVPTPWHHDLTFWPIEGDEICSIWMPLDAVTRASSGLEYVRGSHRWNRRFKAVTPDYNEFMLASDLEDPPDIDHHREDYDLVNWDMQPGDLLIFHPLVVHGSSGNTSMEHRRRALATRWLGDDVVYAPKPATMPLPPGHGLREGDRVGGPLFPRVLGDTAHPA